MLMRKLILLLCSTALYADESTVVAKVGSTEVTLSEVRDSLAKLELKDQALLGRNPETLNKVVRAILTQRLLLSESQAKGHDKQADTLARLERARDTALAESYLASVSEPPAEFPSEAELSTAYANVSSSLAEPKQWRLAQIFIAAPPELTKDKLAEAQSRLDALKKGLAAAGADFAALADKYSDDTATAEKGGEIGWLAENGIVVDIRSEASLLKAGEVSPPIRLKDGWHVLKCLELREAYTPKFADVKEALRQRLRQERTLANSQAYVARLLQENPMSVNELALKAALPAPAKK
jgi:parvulin-like peptidyl-prolyl isomerase